MADPTKIPNNDPDNLRNRNTVEPGDRPVIRNRRNYPWAWIIAIIIILLIIWAFFGWNNRSRVAAPVATPAPATSTVR